MLAGQLYDGEQFVKDCRALMDNSPRRQFGFFNSPVYDNGTLYIGPDTSNLGGSMRPTLSYRDSRGTLYFGTITEDTAQKVRADVLDFILNEAIRIEEASL